MDFFQHQERAHRRTGLLVVLFLCAVAGTVACVNLAIVPFIASDAAEAVAMVVVVTGCVLVTIAIGSLVRLVQMSGGGRAVAEALGGRPLDPSTSNSHERRALNVVEEMAIAAGLPVPPVYLLPDTSINAFAAGRGPSDSVIGLTQGCLDRLTRDELQGVVAHEFSHIFHQDTRLNMRLVCLLGGILAISMVGRVILRGAGRSKSDKGGVGIALFGLALFLIGSIGYFFGWLIQLAVSRQREFLADASAVQYTRNPDGLASALEKISRGAGSSIVAPRAAEFSHFLFASGFDSYFSTHPDVQERIARIRGLTVEQVQRGPDAPAGAAAAAPLMGAGAPPVIGARTPLGAGAAGAAGGAIGAPLVAAAVGRIGRVSPSQLDQAAALMAQFPPALLRAAHDPFAARAVVLGMLLSSDANERGAQIEAVRAAEPRLLQNILLIEPALGSLPVGHRLPLLKLCAGSMAMFSAHQYAEFRALVTKFIQVDRQVDRFEWSVNVLLRRAVERRGAGTDDAPPPTQRDMALATAVLCYTGSRTPADARQAWQAARGANRELPPEIPAADACTLDALDNSLRSLDKGKPSLKQITLAGCVAAVCADGVTTPVEAELLQSVSDCIGVPLPPIMA